MNVLSFIDSELFAPIMKPSSVILDSPYVGNLINDKCLALRIAQNFGMILKGYKKYYVCDSIIMIKFWSKLGKLAILQVTDFTNGFKQYLRQRQSI